MIIWYSETCEGCSGNHALAKIKTLCEKNGLEFEERRTILWEVYEAEADDIMEANEGLKLPFFYGTESEKVLGGYSQTPLDTLEKLVEAEKNALGVE